MTDNTFHLSDYLALGTKFDSRNRYIRQVVDPANKTLNMVRGPSIEITVQTSGVNTEAAWRWRVNDATLQGIDPNLSSGPDGFNAGIDAAL